MGEWMPTGETGTTEGLQIGACPVILGLNLLHNTIVDQHFLVRNRLMRFFAALLEKPLKYGIGLDEDAWIIIRGKEMHVEKGQVVFCHKIGNRRQQERKSGIDRLEMRVLLSVEKTTF